MANTAKNIGNQGSDGGKNASSAVAMILIDQYQNQIEEMLRKYNYRTFLRVTAYMIRFTRHAKRKNAKKLSGCLKTEEIANAERLWLRYVQKGVKTIPQVDLMKDEGVLRVCSRMSVRMLFI